MEHVENTSGNKFIYRFLFHQSYIVELYHLIVEKHGDKEIALVEQPQKERVISRKNCIFNFDIMEQCAYLLASSLCGGVQSGSSSSLISASETATDVQLTIGRFLKGSYTSRDISLKCNGDLNAKNPNVDFCRFKHGLLEYLVVSLLNGNNELCIFIIQECSGELDLHLSYKIPLLDDGQKFSLMIINEMCYVIIEDARFYALDCLYNHECEILMEFSGLNTNGAVFGCNHFPLIQKTNGNECFVYKDQVIHQVELNIEAILNGLVHEYTSSSTGTVSDLSKRLAHILFSHSKLTVPQVRGFFDKLIKSNKINNTLHWFLENFLLVRCFNEVFDGLLEEVDAIVACNTLLSCLPIPKYLSKQNGSATWTLNKNGYGTKFAFNSSLLKSPHFLLESFDLDSLLKEPHIKKGVIDLSMRNVSSSSESSTNSSNAKKKWDSLLSKLFSPSTASPRIASSAPTFASYLDDESSALFDDSIPRKQFTTALESFVLDMYSKVNSLNHNTISLSSVKNSSSGSVSVSSSLAPTAASGSFMTKGAHGSKSLTLASSNMSKAESLAKRILHEQTNASSYVWSMLFDLVDFPKTSSIMQSCECRHCKGTSGSGFRSRIESTTPSPRIGGRDISKAHKDNKYVYKVLQKQQQVENASLKSPEFVEPVKNMKEYFNLLHEFYSAFNFQCFPAPTEFSSKFAIFGLHCLSEAVFLQYLDHGVFRLTDSFMKHAADVLMMKNNTAFFIQIISRFHEDSKYTKSLKCVSKKSSNRDIQSELLESKLFQASTSNPHIFSTHVNRTDSEGRLLGNDLMESALSETQPIRKKSTNAVQFFKRLSIQISSSFNSGSGNSENELDMATDSLEAFDIELKEDNETKSAVGLERISNSSISASSTPIPIGSAKQRDRKHFTSEGIYLSGNNKSTSISASSYDNSQMVLGETFRTRSQIQLRSVTPDDISEADENDLSPQVQVEFLPFKLLSKHLSSKEVVSNLSELELWNEML